MNRFVIRVYSSGAPLYAPELASYAGLNFTTQYPAGLFGTCQFRIANTANRAPSNIRGGMDIKIHHGEMLAWEGVIDDLDYAITENGQTITVNCVGAWAQFMERRGCSKRWADDALDINGWTVDTSGAAGEKFTYDRRDRLRITPKGVSFANGNSGRLDYYMPTGETVARVAFDWDLQEAAQAWSLRIREFDTPTVLVTKSSSSTGTTYVDLGTPRNRVSFEMQSNASQTGVEDGTLYAEISNVTVYGAREDTTNGTLGTVDIYEIALDIRQLLNGEISADIDQIDSGLTYSLTPFSTNEWESFASILARAASFGDTSQNPVGYGLQPSSVSSDQLPKLFIESYPTTVTYILDPSVDVSYRINVGDVYNYIYVKFVNNRGQDRLRSPSDSSLLTDAASVTAYGRKDLLTELPGRSAFANAIAHGQRVLARHKDPTYSITSPVEVNGLRGISGDWTPAAFVQAGQRIRLEGILDNTGTPLNMLITETRYNEERDTVQLSLGGTPDRLEIYLAQLARSL